MPRNDSLFYFFDEKCGLDDRQILFTRQGASGEHLELLPVAGGEPTRLLTGKGSEANGQISPDGKWVAYASDE